MLIRKAKAAEAECIASYVMLAMGKIAYQFIGERSYEKAIRFLTSLISRERNQYSYENCWVVESGEDIIAVAIVC